MFKIFEFLIEFGSFIGSIRNYICLWKNFQFLYFPIKIEDARLHNDCDVLETSAMAIPLDKRGIKGQPREVKRQLATQCLANGNSM